MRAEDEGGVADFLAKAIEPPIETAVESAMQLLQTIGALAEGEKLTTLGRHLANLPLHPRIGKMMLFASMLSTTKPNLTAACAASYRSPFVMPLDPEQKKRAEAAKRSFSDEYGGSSDHLATTAAFERWDDAKRFGNERRFLDEHQLTGATLSMIAGMRSQLEGALMDRGVLRDHRNANMNARDPALVRAALAASATRSWRNTHQRQLRSDRSSRAYAARTAQAQMERILRTCCAWGHPRVRRYR